MQKQKAVMVSISRPIVKDWSSAQLPTVAFHPGKTGRTYNPGRPALRSLLYVFERDDASSRIHKARHRYENICLAYQVDHATTDSCFSPSSMKAGVSGSSSTFLAGLVTTPPTSLSDRDSVGKAVTRPSLYARLTARPTQRARLFPSSHARSHRCMAGQSGDYRRKNSNQHYTV